MQADHAVETRSILVLGAGELGLCVLRELAKAAATEGGVRITVLLRPVAAASIPKPRAALLEQSRVLVHPGYFFDFPRDGYLVVSLLTRPGVFRSAVLRMLTSVAS